MNRQSAFDAGQIEGLSVRDLIDLRAQSTPDGVYLVDPVSGQTTTYRQLRDLCRTVATRIDQHGVKPGEAVAYALTNGPASAICILGTMYGGYLATAINLVAGNDTISYVLSHSRTRLVLHQADTLPLIANALKEHDNPPPVQVVNDDFWQPHGDLRDLSKSTCQDDGLLMYTSGTTGRPKGVVLRQSSVIAGGSNAALAHHLTAADRALCVLPIYHINGAMVTVAAPLVSAGSVVMPARFSAGA